MRNFWRQHKYLLAVVLVGGGLSAYFAYIPSTFSGESAVLPFVPAPYRGPVVQIGEMRIKVEVSTTTTQIRRGLSSRPSLHPERGMLFVFGKPAKYRFWMPDMQFPLDMIWIEKGKVVSITERAMNDFDPAKPVFYTPSAPVRYVLEVNAGFAARHGLKPGDPVVFRNL